MFTDLQPGMVFHENGNKNVSITVQSLSGEDVTYKSSYFGQEKVATLSKRAVLQALNYGNNWELEIKERNPCAEIFKREYFAKPSCAHKNVRRDLFFSAKAYLTCKDCGQPLN
jgi:hypothetical protein